jgi:hypothetical protein
MRIDGACQSLDIQYSAATGVQYQKHPFTNSLPLKRVHCFQFHHFGSKNLLSDIRMFKLPNSKQNIASFFFWVPRNFQTLFFFPTSN